MEESDESKWKIPYGITFPKVEKIITLILTRKGDRTTQTLDSIHPLASLAKNFLSSNLSFLNSINVIDGDNNGFKLTKLGTDFANALSMGNEEDVKKFSMEIISKSHLNDLKDLIENEGSAITKEKLLKFIKTRARISGESISSMPKSSSVGANALLSWFSKIGIVSNEVADNRIQRDTSLRKKQTEKSSMGRLKEKPRIRQQDPIYNDATNNFILNTGQVSLSIDKNIELEDLELAKKQSDMLFEHAKTKIKSKSE